MSARGLKRSRSSGAYDIWRLASRNFESKFNENFEGRHTNIIDERWFELVDGTDLVSESIVRKNVKNKLITQQFQTEPWCKNSTPILFFTTATQSGCVQNFLHSQLILIQGKESNVRLHFICIACLILILNIFMCFYVFLF